MSQVVVHTDLDFAGEFDLIAKSLVKEKKKRRRGTPNAANLATALSELRIEDTIHGSSTLDLTIYDEDYRLLDEGFFDADENGRLDPIDLQYPFGTRHWWRLTQVQVSDDQSVVMSFMERPAVYMQYHHGPLKASRGKMTRAQFMRGLTARIKAGGGIRFVSKDLYKKQKVEHVKEPKRRSESKAKGISLEEARDLTIGGAHASSGQIKVAEAVLDVAEELQAGELATLALLVACIQESTMQNLNRGDRDSLGVLQVRVSTSGSAAKSRDIEWSAREFLNVGFYGKRDPSAKGAIDLAKKHPHWSAGEIAQENQGSAFPDRYDKWITEAKALMQAYGGVSGGAGTYMKQYNFRVKDKENFWDASKRLAEQEVNWRFFLDGNIAYFDPETTLIKQKPVAVIRRSDPAIVSWRYTVDNRQIASEMTLDLVCDPMEFRAGEVFKLSGFGPASSASSVKLPGRWLIEEVERNRSDVFSTFTLKQPEDPKLEPASTKAALKQDAALGVGATGTPKNIIDTIVVPIAVDLGFDITAESIAAANQRHSQNTSSGNKSDHKGPPSQAWAADISDGSSPTPRMDKMAKALLARFDGPSKNIPSPKATSGAHSENAVSWESDGYRFQLIYRSLTGGNHYNHVHIGIKWLKFHGPPTPGVTTDQLVPEGSPPVMTGEFPR